MTIQSSASYLDFDPENPAKLPVPIPVVERPRPMSSVTASASRLTSRTMKRSTFKTSTDSDWQQDAWEMYDQVGEQRFLVNTLAGRMAQARFYVGVVHPENSHDEPDESEDETVNAILESLGGDFSGLARMIKRMAINLSIAGDGWIVGVPASLVDPEKESQSVEDANVYMSDLEWYMLSVSEVIFDRDKVKLHVDSNGEPVEASVDDVFLIRVWSPHPRKAWEADSPTRSSLPVLRELVGLTMHISAQVDSRLAGAGIFLIPQSAQQAVKTAAGMDEDDDTDVFAESLMEAMITPINDRSSASAVVPLTVTAPDDSIDKFRHISFSTELDSEAREMRDEAIRRLALGQDAPPELLLGTGGMNHWGAWLVREDVVTTHLEPTLALIADALTTQYLRPVLREAGYPDEKIEQFVVWYKVDHMIARPNRGTDAQTLHGMGVISDATLREANGFDDNDAPEVDEDESNQLRTQAVEQALALVRSAPSLARDPGLEALTDVIEELLTGGETEGLDDAVADGVEEGDAPADPDAPPETDGEPAAIDEPAEGEPA